MLSQLDAGRTMMRKASLQGPAGLNQVVPATAVSVTEIRDTIVPTVISATLNYGTGILIIEASETIDITPSSNVDVSRLHVSNATGNSDVSLAGQTVNELDNLLITITMSETTERINNRFV